ncbi:hypothetical protein [Saccharibacillus alkalitolerans]|uniref:Uncharacterized protein n=1 Tax=Saccharibacillus alkalitolerans TaxID=2705290 RepID=A0ABX0F5U7_9BACL|nr:hypothetical protein [Saccharibacillus alkalitolerans]NGZ75300.1 hypothetical protein [Saccharibacillus alkalitolerans]
MYIEHIFDKSIAQIRLRPSVDYAALHKMLYEGIGIGKAKAGGSEEARLLLGMAKVSPERFLIADDPSLLNKELNLRNVFLLCERTGTPTEELRHYREALERTAVRVLGDANGMLSALLLGSGFRLAGQGEGNPAIAVAERECLKEHEEELKSFSRILPYSTTEMTLGPCLFSPEERESLTRRPAGGETEVPSRGASPSYANVLTVYSLLINNLMYLINDTHQKLYVDAALPINRIFRFTLPEMKLTAAQVF